MQKGENVARVEFETWVEIKVNVVACKVAAEGDNWNEPYIPAHVEIEDIDFDKRQALAYIWKEHEPSIREEAWDIIHD